MCSLSVLVILVILRSYPALVSIMNSNPYSNPVSNPYSNNPEHTVQYDQYTDQSHYDAATVYDANAQYYDPNDQQHQQQQHYIDPSTGQPQYDQSQYDHSQYDQTQYDQTQYDQPQYDQPQYDQHGYVLDPAAAAQQQQVLEKGSYVEYHRFVPQLRFQR